MIQPAETCRLLLMPSDASDHDQRPPAGALAGGRPHLRRGNRNRRRDVRDRGPRLGGLGRLAPGRTPPRRTRRGTRRWLGRGQPGLGPLRLRRASSRTASTSPHERAVPRASGELLLEQPDLLDGGQPASGRSRPGIFPENTRQRVGLHEQVGVRRWSAVDASSSGSCSGVWRDVLLLEGGERPVHRCDCGTPGSCRGGWSAIAAGGDDVVLLLGWPRSRGTWCAFVRIATGPASSGGRRVVAELEAAE